MKKSLSKLNLILLLSLFFSFTTNDIVAQAEGWQQLNDKTLELLRAGAYTEALNAGIVAHEKAAVEYGYKHHNYIASLHNLASAYTKLANYDQARYLFNNALQISNKTYGKDQVIYAISAYRLGDLLQLIEQPDAAQKLYLEALPILKEKEGENSFHYTSALSQMAKLYLSQGEVLKAEETLMKSAELREKCDDCTMADKAQNIHLLANIYGQMGRSKEAADLFNKTLAARADAQGKTHPDYAATLQDYAAQISKKDPAKAIELLLEAATIQKVSLGVKHPTYLKCSDDLKQLQGVGNTSMAK